MRVLWFASVGILACVAFPAHADSLDGIAAFAEKICTQSLSGDETSTTITANLNGDVNGLAKALGISVGARGLVKKDGTHYQGIPKEKLPSSIPTPAQCRLELAKVLIEERQKLAATTPIASPSAFNPPPHSIAVLPFENISDDKQRENFSDGISVQLIDDLSHFASLQVIAHTSTFAFKDQQVDIATIARKLNVAAVLEGSVRRDQNRVRITAQLIDTRNGFVKWSKVYDRDLKDTFELESDIALAVAKDLRAQLLGDESVAIKLGGTRNREALDAYLRGNKISPDAMNETVDGSAVSAFDAAIGQDPNFALAYAQKANALIGEAVDTNNLSDRQDLIQQATQAAERALQLAPDLADAHAAMASVYHINFDDERAVRESHLAEVRAPGNVRILSTIAIVDIHLDHRDAALSAARQFVLLDPLNRQSRSTLAYCLYFAREFAEALTVAQDAKAMGLDSPRLEMIVAASYLAIQDPAKTLAMFTASPAPTNERWQQLFFPTMAYQALGKREEADSYLRKLMATFGDSRAYNYAEIYAQRNEIEQGLQWLKKAEELKDPTFHIIRNDWMVDPLRKRLEFKATEERLHFAP